MADYKSKHLIQGSTAGAHITTLTSLVGMFSSVLFVLWDDTGFITRNSVRSSISKREDAVIRLYICGTNTGGSAIAEIEIYFPLPVEGKYRDYGQVPDSVWNTIRSALSTWIVTTQSYSVYDGRIQ